MDPIELLARDDKWYLGCGDGIIFAPPFPVWLDSPGFWDGATVFQYTFAPLFSVAILDADGREIPMRSQSRRWTPAELTLEYRLANGVAATEVRTVHPDGIFVSEWRLRALRPMQLHLVAWTTQESASISPDSVRWRRALTFERTVRDQSDVPLAVLSELACVGETTSWAASVSDAGPMQPNWGATPFPEKWSHEGLPSKSSVEGLREGLQLHAAVHRALVLAEEDVGATFAMRLVPSNTLIVGPRDPGAPRSGGQYHGTLGGASRRRWSELFGQAPRFRCSDPYLETYYWYRWYGLWLNAIATGKGNYEHPTMCEGIGALHRPSASSAACHARELRWLHDPAHARGVLRTFFHRQHDDGSLPGRICINHLEGAGFLHANWGDAILAVDASAPDDAFIAEMYPRLSRYGDWLMRTRDADDTGMLDVLDLLETGPGATRRSLPAERKPRRAARGSRLKGIDVTVYAYAVFRCLQRLAKRAGAAADIERWEALAARTASAVRGAMWNPGRQMFSDVDPRRGARRETKMAVCFHPYFTDIATAEHLGGLEHILCDPAQFWTSFPVPSTSADDPAFDPLGVLEGKRHSSPSNGRVWPRINSHAVEALARASLAYAPHLRAVTGHFLLRFVRMMFHDGELERANCYEHYNPFSGRASLYRGIDDHQHSWVNDLIIQYVAGVRPHDAGISIDPFPLGLEIVELTGVRARGMTLDVRVDGDRVRVTVDGVAREGKLGVRMEIGE